MISCDTNILFMALDSASLGHRQARTFLEAMAETEPFALCELVLLELYGLLRNPVVCHQPYSAPEAAQVIHRFRGNSRWAILDYPGPQSGIMKKLWPLAAAKAFPHKRIYDLRLALTLRHHGVTEFATRNVKDFEGFGFKRVWDPMKDA